MTTLTAREKGLFIPLMIGLILLIAAQWWSSAELSHASDAMGETFDTGTIKQMMAFHERLKIANMLISIGYVVMAVSLIGVLVMAGRNEHTALMLKLFVAVPALYAVITGVAGVIRDREAQGLIMFFFGIMLLLPNRLLLRERFAGLTYIIGLLLSMTCWILLVRQSTQAMSPESILRIMAMLVTALIIVTVAASVSFCTAYRQTQKDGMGQRLAHGYSIAATFLLIIVFALHLWAQIPSIMETHQQNARIKKFMDAVEPDQDPAKAGPQQ